MRGSRIVVVVRATQNTTADNDVDNDASQCDVGASHPKHLLLGRVSPR